jgi:hypothetical protein
MTCRGRQRHHSSSHALPVLLFPLPPRITCPQRASALKTASVRGVPTAVMDFAVDISAMASLALFTALVTSVERTVSVPTVPSSAVRRRLQCCPGAASSVPRGAKVRLADTCASACGVPSFVLVRRAVSTAPGSGVRTGAMARRALRAATGSSARATAKEQAATRAALAKSVPATTLTRIRRRGATHPQTRSSNRPKSCRETTAVISGPRPSPTPLRSPQL